MAGAFPFAIPVVEGGRGDWSVRGIRARCVDLRRALAGRGVPAAVLDARWPGGADNARGRGAWVRCFALYTALAARPEGAGAAGSGGAEDRPARDAALRDAIAAAAADRPQAVTCSDDVVRYAHPKSYAAHELLRALDGAVQAAQAAEAAEQALGAAPRAPVLRSLAVRVWLWVVTHPGPGLPFDPHAATDAPDPPVWTLDVAPADVVALVFAFRRVNHERAALLADAFPPGGAPSRLGFEGFLAGFAGAKRHDPYAVLHGWSVTRPLAVAVSEAVAYDEADRAAKAKAAAAPKAGAR